MLRSCRRHATNPRLYRRGLATVTPSIVAKRPPALKAEPPSFLDARVLHAAAQPHTTSIGDIVKQYLSVAGTVLDVSLPYESRPGVERRTRVGKVGDVVTVAHVARDGDEHKITLASGFALNASVDGGETLVLTCAHTLEELRKWPLLMSGTRKEEASGTFVVAGAGEGLQVFPVSRVVSTLPRSDLLLLACAIPKGTVRALPVSPYPAPNDTAIQAHFVAHAKPTTEGWSAWVGDTWGKWEAGRVVGYRDFAGREAEVGTYDALSHLLFTPLPTPGSSGGPLVDAQTGAVVGVTLGTQVANRVDGVRGWAVPAEAIFEMFSLPGLGSL